MRLREYREKPPEIVTIDGIDYTLNNDFADCITTIEALCDEELFDFEKAEIIISNMYSEPYPEDTNEAIRLAVNYLMQGREITEQDQKRPVVLDFEKDEQWIYDAFMRIGIDLYKAKMSYWEFMSRLRELPGDCMLSRVIYWRSVPYGKLSKEEKAAIEKIGKDKIFIQNKENAAERSDEYNEFMALLKG